MPEKYRERNDAGACFYGVIFRQFSYRNRTPDFDQ
jgi:hypothetical protein